MVAIRRTQTRYETPDVATNLRTTIKLIGRAIRDGSSYAPLRAHAAKLATRAKPKDYFGQLKHVYNDFVKRWRYVRDPLHYEAVTIDGPAIWGQVWGADGGGLGYGDCDDATTAIGAALSSIGFPVRVATLAGPNFPGPLSHVYAQAHVAGIGWISVDPVGFPKHPLGWSAPRKRQAIWDLNGNLISKFGNWPSEAEGLFKGAEQMQQQFTDYGLESVGLAGFDEPLEFNVHGMLGFGAYANSMGLIADANGFMAEVDELDTIEGTYGLVATPILEMSPTDYKHVLDYGQPRMGAVALSGDGEVYQYQPIDPQRQYMGGWFKKLFKKIGKKIKKGFKKIKGLAKKLIQKLPGGKYLLKLYGKVHKIAMKLVRPLTKFVGKYAAKLAPIAALIPGYGPAIAAGLYTAGKIANVMNRVGVVVDKVGRPIFKSGSHAKAFRTALKMEAAKHVAQRGLKKGSRTHMAYVASIGAI